MEIMVQIEDIEVDELGDGTGEGGSHRRRYDANSGASEVLKLMRFNPLTFDIAKDWLSNHGGEQVDLPLRVTNEQLKTIFDISSTTFMIGRSGTGKTTILVLKLFLRETHCYKLSKGIGFATSGGNNVGQNIPEPEEIEAVEETDETPLRQLFVTVNSRLCYAVKQHLSQLKRFACRESDSSEGHTSPNMDDVSEVGDLPKSFVGIDRTKYPLVITFEKFLMMLDSTVGISFFERYSDGPNTLTAIDLETVLRSKEVTYDRFMQLYWTHFDVNLTKKLDSSRVFTEIISHIKGGLKNGRVSSDKLSREDYLLLSKGDVSSSLNTKNRRDIYDIFESYEESRTKNNEFDLADLVNDLHCRLKNADFEGDSMDFVYIDEVQDLTIRQLALFKYICRNVEEGFVFAGDTAQTIARGIDFRFADIRSLFYNEFLTDEMKSTDGGKGLISNTLCLEENFRTHDGVLKLGQSVIDLLLHFFKQNFDVLNPEKSLICGEVPTLLESGDEENAIVCLFGNKGDDTALGDLAGFGAAQVILVRDDSTRNEISSIVDKQALVLTILECKGLEFQDVLLYNFFSSSPFNSLWRLINEFLDDKSKSHPKFDSVKHNGLCSELKQLYVAITRTIQRLWICEDRKGYSNPMYDYWKKKSLVQVKKLDESLAQAMQVASSPDEWKLRGIQLLSVSNFAMATRCFERAGDLTLEQKAKAAGMKARGDFLCNLDPGKAHRFFSQAAEKYESIGMTDCAADCYCQSGEYEKAGTLYLEKYGDDKLYKAGECFELAGCFEKAAEVYAKGHYHTNCLSVCFQGDLFNKGMDYIQEWEELDKNGFFTSHRGEVLGDFRQSFFEVAKYVFGSQNPTHQSTDELPFVDYSVIDVYINHLFPINWWKTLDENMISFRKTDLSSRLLEESINKCIPRAKFSEIVMILLGSGKHEEHLYTRILSDCPQGEWYELVKMMGDSDFSGLNFSGEYDHSSSLRKLFEGLKCSDKNSSRHNFISPKCFFYLADRLLLRSFAGESFFTTKSSLVEDILSGSSFLKCSKECEEEAAVEILRYQVCLFLGRVTLEFICNQRDAVDWVGGSVSDYDTCYRSTLLRAVVILCLLFLNHGEAQYEGFDRFLENDDVASFLPSQFINIIRKKEGGDYLIKNDDLRARVVAEAFMKIGDPLVVVSLSEYRSELEVGDCIFVDRNAACDDDVLKMLSLSA